jgi:hypothetical protein
VDIHNDTCPPTCGVTGFGVGDNPILGHSQLTMYLAEFYTAGVDLPTCAGIIGNFEFGTSLPGGGVVHAHVIGNDCFDGSNRSLHHLEGSFSINGGTERFQGAMGQGTFVGTRQCVPATCYYNNDDHTFEIDVTSVRLYYPREIFPTPTPGPSALAVNRRAAAPPRSHPAHGPVPLS